MCLCSSPHVPRLTYHQDEHEQEIPDTYNVHYYLGTERLLQRGFGIKLQISFRSVEFGDKTISAPHPRLIAIHAACARIAHMSGAAQHLEELFRGSDQISLMIEPNAAYHLTQALKMFQLVSTTA
jgi:hypothetical protein